MKDLLEQIRQSAMEQLSRVDADLSEIRVKYLGKKGELTAVLRSMGSLSPEERPAFGQRANEVRAQIEAEIERRQTEMKSAMRDRALRAEKLDVTVPGEDVPFGHIHPLSRVQHEIEDIFIGMGYSIAEGPEVELDYYNFQALNIPPEHPARDTQDTFLSPGRVYRSDAVDATHSPLFHQIEGLVVDRGVTMGDLKGTLAMFARRMFGSDTKIRFRPHHFPFTEPSAEVDVSCFACGGKGCRFCKGEGWIEILGAGMVHPNVLSGCSIDPEEYSGFAFGLGVERVALLKYHIDDMRLLYENDVRFLGQF